MQKLMLSLAGFRSAFGVMSAYRDVATVVTGSMGVPGRDISGLREISRRFLTCLNSKNTDQGIE
ncbi:Uncharacterized protein TCM_010483 [Theobroma cacao]|uniref:Uncharacterized protein n=1 Tax=Theobroma cacao TaxID=3641 RepID=A0A061EE91_THECC|nr:Uncharacterized protein TCM_010483 [Theobroma cacao]